MRQTLLLCITLVTAGTLCAQNFNKGKMDSLFTILNQKDKYMAFIILSFQMYQKLKTIQWSKNKK